MNLYHYSAEPFVFDRGRTYEQPPLHFKPVGLWLSVEDDWQRWCEGENFNKEGLAHRTQIAVRETNVLLISNVYDLDEFTVNYRLSGTPTYDVLRAIDWPRLKSLYDGIIIAPYLWERRHSPHTFWYYTWDCASACIWNAAALETAEVTVMSKDFELKVIHETAVERTKAAMQTMTEGRRNQARAFFNRVEKRRKKRKMEKATRKRMR